MTGVQTCALPIYHCDTKQWKFHDQCMDVLLEKAKEKEWAQKAANRELGITSNACESGEYLWISAPYTNQLLRFSMADSTYAFSRQERRTPDIQEWRLTRIVYGWPKSKPVTLSGGISGQERRADSACLADCPPENGGMMNCQDRKSVV